MDFEKDLDALIESFGNNTDGGFAIPEDAAQVMLQEFNARLLCKVLNELSEIKEALKK